MRSLHGLNPFFSNAMFVPTGVNLAQNTASPLLGLITAPFDLAFSPVVSANLLMLLAMPVSATAAFVVLRKWQVWEPAAAIGGLIYGFSPYMVGQSLDHVELIFVPLPPLHRFDGRIYPATPGFTPATRDPARPPRGGPVLHLAGGTRRRSPSSPFSRGMRGAPPSGELPELVRKVWRPAGIALALSALLLAYPVWMMLAGPQHFIGSTWPAMNPYHNDLLSFVVPGPLQKVSLGMRAIGTRLAFGSDCPRPAATSVSRS